MEYRLLCGDCLDRLPLILDGTIDLIVADLPYGITRNRWDCTIPLIPLWEQLWRVAKPRAAILLFASGMFTADVMQSGREFWRYNLVWEKTQPTGFLNAHKMPLRAHEDIRCRLCGDGACYFRSCIHPAHIHLDLAHGLSVQRIDRNTLILRTVGYMISPKPCLELTCSQMEQRRYTCVKDIWMCWRWMRTVFPIRLRLSARR